MPARAPAKKGLLRLPPGPGRAGEAAAEAHVRSLGWKVLARNYRTREGEIDIVASDGGTLVFIEVKTRRASIGRFGTPEESLTRAKQVRLVAAAQWYLAENSLTQQEWRVDLIAVELDRAGRAGRVELYANVVEEHQ